MQQDLNRVIEQVSKEKGIDKTILISALENAMVSAAKKMFGHQRKIEAQYNPELGEVELFEAKLVVEEIQDAAVEITLQEARENLDPDAQLGDELLSKLDTSSFGRIAAQAAKQNIVQRVRDAEREIIYNEFKGREGQLVNGIVQRFEKKNIIVNLGRTDAILPEKEQVPRERYRQGDRIRAYIVSVEMTSRGPQIVLSRTHPGMLAKLFEQEVPEIYEGIVEVKCAAREPGGRAKIAVTSSDPDVDPVGACVGMKGTRVQAVVQELRGEKIDIVNWTANQDDFVCRALAPAKVSKIIIDDEAHSMEVIVPDDQLSLAIGKKGQNVRLAARLSGWRIDVRSESEADEETRRARASLGAIPAVNDMVAELLYQAGFKSAEELSEADLESIVEVDGISPDKAEAIYKSSREHVAEKRRKEEEEKAEKAAAQAATEAAAAEAAATETGATEESAEKEPQQA
ncbi:MAG: transcription termination/antitermination protein NusA [Deltaproteobacteria bacterium RIFCSPHIGHO2_02_FULL_60_17]|nr:MAG: transcription termination/antitermination protein NusA [Deltaproteobacteria bacterium RIFCSPHIGHO2_02_FULL_60_17]